MSTMRRAQWGVRGCCWTVVSVLNRHIDDSLRSSNGQVQARKCQLPVVSQDLSVQKEIKQ